jgi:chromosome segregation ATPase
MSNLYEISQDYAAIIAAVEEAEGELTPELEEALAANGEDFAAKIENYLKAIRNFEADAAACKEEAARFKAKEERAKKTAERLKESVMAAMQQRGIQKQDFGNLTASVRKTERVVVDDDLIATLPDDFKRVKTTIEPDKTALKTALKAGATIEGAQLVDNYSLNIK